MSETNKSSSRWQRFLDNDIVYSFFTTPGAIIAASITFIAITAAFAAPIIAPYNPFDPAQISLWDGKLPPAWADGGSPAYLLGTDNQGRDMLSTILYGGRISILVGIAAVFLGMLLGVTLGVISGYFGGLTDTIIMRIADVQLTIPGILVAILINGIGRAALPFAAPIIAPYNPFDPAQISLWDGKLPPAWADGGSPAYLLGTDNQGRDMLSTILYGGRISILVGIAAVFLGMLLGVTLGVISGYFGGLTDTIIMRIADVQLTIPGILVAILINGIGRAALPLELREEFAIYVVIVAIGLTDWPQFARVARGATLVEAEKEYVQAAKLIGLPKFTIILRHILPNTLRPVLVIATIGLALAIIAEATLSFLGQGIPPTTPSLGTLIRVGNEFLFSGLWWITFFPAIALIILVFSVNLLGDWMRDALNPKLR